MTKRFTKTNTGERAALRCVWLGRFYTGKFLVGVVVTLWNLECSEQDRADEQEHGGDNHHIQSQGKVHVRASLVEVIGS